MNSKTSDQTLEGGAQAGGADSGSLGDQLRRAREARGVSLRAISEQTRITMRHLEAIESDDYKHLPGGIFNRSFIKAYARYIRFDERTALELYARTARERGEEDEEPLTTPQRSRIYTDGDSVRSPAVTFLLSALIIGILILVVYAGLHWYRRTETPASNAVGSAGQSAAQVNPATTQTATQQQQTTTETTGFQLQIRAKGKAFWLTTLQDDDKKRKGRMLFPDKPEDFTPASDLTLMFDRPASESLEVSINGRTAKLPDTAASTGQWKITRDNYQQFLQ
ncbi:MAG: helix-turn-helix domain-containing protein [Pyrinomonadaceae bacterium]